MAIITWNDSLSVNISEIDMQHKKLITMINELNDAMGQGKGQEVLGKIIDGLAEYAATHFRTEEKYFDQYGYPDSASHKKTHAEFVNKVSDFKKKFEKGQITLSIEIMNFLSDWLRNHIMKVDKKYSRFFNERGLR
ncbi:MAG TPA: bacteriohemerythrin [Nitrospirae bacterium]|nr:bacteriohemerythrin [Nitrospirota bacterium]